MRMAGFMTVDDLDVRGKVVLTRVDLNVPMDNGKVTDQTRIEKVLPTITNLQQRGAKVVLLAHLGRPKNKRVAEFSLKPIAAALQQLLPGCRVGFADDCIGAPAEQAIAAMKDGDILLLENVRFHAGEEQNAPDFCRSLAALGEYYVNDAFSAAHRAHASTEGLARLLPSAAGLLMQAELEALEKALTSPARPVLAIVGGAKVSTKIDLLMNLVARVDAVAIGGGMANTFLFALGHNVGASLCEKDAVATVQGIIERAGISGCQILLPQDVVVADAFKANATHHTCRPHEVPEHGMILDIGELTVAAWRDFIGTCKTVVWNGPVGAFELTPFDAGTMGLAAAVVQATQSQGLQSIAGGGDTLAALGKADAMDKLTYVSTAGGAFLEWMEGKDLPGVVALYRRPRAEAVAVSA